MTVGSGLFISEDEQDKTRQNHVIRQLLEGRSNAVGIATLDHDGTATTTTVTASVCGPASAVFLFPASAHAAAALSTTYVTQANVSAAQFVISHAATSQTDQTFWWVCLG